MPSWNALVNHPNYDQHYKTLSPLTTIQYPQIPDMQVGGYCDQKDLNGPQLMYFHLEKKDSFNRNYIVLGPWNHGGWARLKGDSLAKLILKVRPLNIFKNCKRYGSITG